MLLRFFSQEALEPEQPKLARMEALSALKEKWGEGRRSILVLLFIELSQPGHVFVGGPKRDRPPKAKALLFAVCHWWEIRHLQALQCLTLEYLSPNHFVTNQILC